MSYRTFAKHVAANLAAVEMKVSTADLRKVDIDPQWIYLNRIGKKIRILKPSDAIGVGGRVRSTIKVPWNPYTYEREQVERYIRHLMPALHHYANRGSCHPFRTLSQVAAVLSGAVDQSNPRVWHIRAPKDMTPDISRSVRLKVLGVR